MTTSSTYTTHTHGGMAILPLRRMDSGVTRLFLKNPCSRRSPSLPDIIASLDLTSEELRGTSCSFRFSDLLFLCTFSYRQHPHDHICMMLNRLSELIGRSLCWRMNDSSVVAVETPAHNLSEMSKMALQYNCKESMKYFTEMHSFEDADYNQDHLSPNKSALELAHIERRHRIRNCKHTYYLI